jgi:putative oxidoreductase
MPTPPSCRYDQWNRHSCPYELTQKASPFFYMELRKTFGVLQSRDCLCHRASRPLERGVHAICFLGFDCVLNIRSLRTGPLLQRLFSTFPDGWPGTGLVFLRTVAAILSVQHGIAGLLTAPQPGVVILQLVAAAAAALVLVGFWTPVAGALLAVAELCLAFSHTGDPSIHILLGALGAALAMLGPGALSVDARLFGRKRIEIPHR